jgi:uncharacterized phage protein gp47/JayE
MTMAFGLLSTGFNPKPQQTCRDELNTAIRAKRGNSIDLSDGSFLGMLIGIFSEREGLLWDLAQALYAAGDPDQATDDALDALCAITGTFRTPARTSQVTETLTGTPNTVVNSGTQVKTASTGNLFQTTTAVTITALTAWAINTVYVVGDRRTNNNRAYQCITGGTSAGSGGPTTTAADITDNTVHWTYLGEGTGAIDVTMTSLVADAIVAAARDLTVINTPVGGLQSAINLLDAVQGNLLQTNESLRVTRESQLSQAGTGVADAIRAEILKITGVTSCTVYHNDTDFVDGNGQLPHSVQAVVVGGTDAAIASVLFNNVPAGIQTVGTSSAQVTDSQGNLLTYFFTRPVATNMYVRVVLKYNSASPTKGGYPTNGDTLVKQAIVNFANANQGVGKDAVPSSLGASVFPVYVNGILAAGVQGVLDVTDVALYTDAIATPTAWAPTTSYSATPGSRSVVTNGGRTYICITSGTSAGSGGPTGTSTDITDNTVHWYFLGNTISIDPFHLAAFDTGRITVSSSAGVF